jgi:hypothetical protein
MARYILIDSNSGYIFGDTADFNGKIYNPESPTDAARELDRLFQQIPDRSYVEHDNPPHDNRTGYHVYRADVNGSDAVTTVTDGQDQEMIDAVEADCEYVCFVECIDELRA